MTAPTPRGEDNAASNFIRNIVDEHRRTGKWSGRVETRFPPEPNGYLHYGHAKSICLNFGLALSYSGACHLRFDDTNPTKEEQEYVDAIIEAVQWLGFDWGEHLYFASDYFDKMYAMAEYLITVGKAYVDSLSAEEMRAYRGTLSAPGQDSPYRNRSVAENLELFQRMRAGEFPDGTHILRARIDMASPNINLRDPAIYRIRHATHHRTGDRWCVYPMYTYAHPIEDALEDITHSICTLEFEDQRPFYDWLLDALADGGFFPRPLPQQIEFARLNLTYVVLSKRKLIQLVDEGHVAGWDDPRLPTLVGARRRGFTPEGFRQFAERIGVSKADSWIDMSVLEDCMREHLNEAAERRVAVLDPVKLIITNYPEGQVERCHAPNHPLKPELGKREMPFGRELWIEREDFMETPVKGYHRLYPGNTARLRYGYVVRCTGCEKDADGKVTAVLCEYFPDSKSGTPGADTYKVKGNLHWVAVAHAYAAEVRLYDRLFAHPYPGTRREGDPEDLQRDFLDDINPDSLRVIRAQLEPALRAARPEARFQFERHGYFVADRIDTQEGAPVFNRTVTLRDAWKHGA
ncbi:MAG TPA: glutamine--tRNA ligase/YqeY domain fusion protein [Zoogloea sp.]|uniref:glutamine--tRNA ligase/YqeY domain fusion protein n=1 Tax=Zoogloea sp. TaxID=49181 RepID=UPI002D113551|nr:glutamine--tRNA ligase/YqeY domain fusion protein [Zoogloea sp.]HMV17404.1 glutamine--tRNA ligase/YqeY domain fusion protein [Rhodocyclaceae bacterium]HMV63205.1 glutamine--tRNA ligase/YqeY domain fusion protein [Rhodocyclaceae bacterium]HMY48829.1 glutamine--tRNA ligase/YqeY domain fusion protein [Rhodocyclaceae bacterium]HNA67829.1 glutamine--tRNA ligase/YqeY domain fusion protein [Rhodocyclaceae bacterium]HND23238.1 glutamine--tRNA ligase/YqeY domain fusion protein [Rhodocyclaceae bacter